MRQYRVRWTERATTDLEEAVDYLIRKSERTAAARLSRSATETARSLAVFADRGHSVPELPGEPYRERPVGSYRMIYEIAGDEVHVLAFIHGRRDFLAAWEE